MNYFEVTAAAAAQRLKTDTVNGLSESEAERRLISYGRNRLQDKKKKSFLQRFAGQFNDFMIIILLAAAAVSFITSILAGDADITESVIILAIVTLNALLGTIQDIRAENSMDALKKLSSPHTIVIRGGREYRISSEEIVPGDIIRLRAGDMVCADCRLIECEKLSVDESAFTGESDTVIKDANIIHDSLTATGDIKNMLWSSTHITEGTAKAIVISTGMDTEVGKIAAMLIDTKSSETPLQKRLAHTGRTLGITALFICGIIFMIGTVKHIPPFEMFLTAVSLAVAAIPEGLPAIVTIMLALGVMRMSRHNAIIRNLPSVETLGCATVICTDKTGTLTQNKMKVEEIHSNNDRLLLELCILCSETGEFINPTDRAIAQAAGQHKINCEKYRRTYPRTQFIPFDSNRKRMSALCGDRIIVKGALEYILPLCTRCNNGASDTPLTAQLKRKILQDNERMTNKALRVIACAYRTGSANGKIKETDLTFAGLIGIADPPRPEAREAVETCRDAGIRTIMITGDHSHTALSVAESVSIASRNDTVLTGSELDNLSDAELGEAVKSCNVYARVTPSHKSRIVQALQENGEIAAMTGDGINDAPALSKADIGCSMGISGTDVAKSASDMILTDDNFATIVYAVREGRAIYDNIKKSVKFLLSSNIGEILTVLFSIIFGFAAPLTAIELLWVNLVTDSLPAIALGLDPADNDIMRRKPLDPKKGIFAGGLWFSIAFEGMMIGALALVAYELGILIAHDSTTARTMAFFVLSVSQLVHAFNMRSEGSVIKSGIFKNKYLVASFILGIAAQLAVITIAPVAAVFNVCSLGTICLLLCFILSLMPLVIVELQKALNHR
ncbi:MAG: calcium-translocating P-type ATPase, PMCA-type [Oscillospiraceae bacterium]|nr:calcium-translocating P-type ATPase, PMCA-type [Oscillospiraceae bacterium]